MEIKSFTFNPFDENAYVLWDNSHEGIIIDPGCHQKHERDEIVNYIEESNISVKLIVNTHCHIDHVLGNLFLKEYFGCSLWIPEGELETLRTVEVDAPNWGFPLYSGAEPDFLMSEPDLIMFGNTVLRPILSPGHSPGHLVFYNEKEKTLMAGDVLFRESIGRTDLPGGNHAELLENISKKIYQLPDDTKVFPGHGPSTTIGHERRFNPFIKG